jgi:hypothetical protein
MKYTFGRTLAAQRLENLLTETPSARRKVSRVLSHYTWQLFQITGAREPETVRLCMEMLRDYTLRRLDILKGLTEDMRTYAKNIVIARYRAYRHGFDSLVPILEKMEKKEKRDLTSGDELV